MKKLTTILLATAALLVAAVSCNKEGNEPEDKMAVLSYEVNLSEVTKAIGDGLTADKLACAVYDGETLYAKATVAKADGKFAYTPSLYYGKTYTVVFFAYKDGVYAVSDDLKTITRSGNGEAADAFTYKETVKINADGTLTINGAASTQTASDHEVILTRPFAQLNIGTADLTGMTKVTVTLSSCAASYSAQAGAYAGSQDVTYTSTASEFSSSKFTVDGTDYSPVSLNYLFAADSNVKATIEVYNGDNLIRTVIVDNVPLKANQKTNIYGNLVKGNLTFNVTMNAGFNGTGNNETIE